MAGGTGHKFIFIFVYSKHYCVFLNTLNKSNMPKSEVWKFFKKQKEGKRVKRIDCTLCEKSWKYQHNTSNLWAHLEYNHHDQYSKLKGNIVVG